MPQSQERCENNKVQSIHGFKIHRYAERRGRWKVGWKKKTGIVVLWVAILSGEGGGVQPHVYSLFQKTTYTATHIDKVEEEENMWQWLADNKDRRNRQSERLTEALVIRAVGWYARFLAPNICFLKRNLGTLRYQLISVFLNTILRWIRLCY